MACDLLTCRPLYRGLRDLNSVPTRHMVHVCTLHMRGKQTTTSSSIFYFRTPRLLNKRQTPLWHQNSAIGVGERSTTIQFPLFQSKHSLDLRSITAVWHFTVLGWVLGAMEVGPRWRMSVVVGGGCAGDWKVAHWITAANNTAQHWRQERESKARRRQKTNSEWDGMMGYQRCDSCVERERWRGKERWRRRWRGRETVSSR